MNVGEMQRKLSLWAEQDRGRKFYGLFGLICDMDWLQLAHDYVARNAGGKTAGCDGLAMGDFNGDLEGNLQRLQKSLELGTFVACPVRRAYRPKANGKTRPLGIPSIRDRIVQEAVRMVLEPIFEADFSRLSFGFRPNRCPMDAVSCLQRNAHECRGCLWAVEGDISAYFDTINHRRLMKLLRRRVDDARLLDLVWKFLRAGVTERRLFKTTEVGAPQGGVVSPLLADVYPHELDRRMERYTDLTRWKRDDRRRRGLANFVYARYADDFVILGDGAEEQALEVRQEVHAYLQDHLRLALSLEETKVTHLNDGFDFLGFHLQRSLGHRGLATKLTIPDKALEMHRNTLRAATAPNTQEDSIRTKLLALNRIIGGWRRYHQYTGKAARQFNRMEQAAYWMFAHWLARKHKLSMPETLSRFYSACVAGGPKTLGVSGLRLVRRGGFKAERYFASPFKPNPYTAQEVAIEREELLDERPWLGTERRPGMEDLRPVVLRRDGYTCCVCKESVSPGTAQVDHIRPVCAFKRPVDANVLTNLWTLCVPCHKRKTEQDRQRESRMP